VDHHQVEGQSDPSCEGNKLYAGMACGLLVRNEGLGTYTGNIVKGNDSAEQVRVEGEGTHPTLVRNQVSTGPVGILVHEQARGRLEGNVVKDCLQVGIEFRGVGTSPVSDGNVVSGTSFPLLSSAYRYLRMTHLRLNSAS
jgi:hypothetical protein